MEALPKYQTVINNQSPIGETWRCIYCFTRSVENSANCSKCGKSRSIFHIPLGKLYQVYLSDNSDEIKKLPEIIKSVPDLDYLSAFHYEDIVVRLNTDTYKDWYVHIKSSLTEEVIEAFALYMYEIYCRGKAVFLGMQLMESSIKDQAEWSKSLLAKLLQDERAIISAYTSQIFDEVNRHINFKREAKMNNDKFHKGQRILILVGLSIILIMLILPPWSTKSGSPRGYGLIFYPPNQHYVIDITRLFIQILIISLITVGGIFILQGRTKKEK